MMGKLERAVLQTRLINDQGSNMTDWSCEWIGI